MTYDGHLCGFCRHCCVVFDVAVPEFDGSPDKFKIITKPGGIPCEWLGFHRDPCRIHHSTALFPSVCRDYACPYVLIETPETRSAVLTSEGKPYPYRVHRPDVFSAILAEPWVTANGIMPLVPVQIPADVAIVCVRASKMIPAAIPKNGGFQSVVRKLAKDVPDGNLRSWLLLEREYCR